MNILVIEQQAGELTNVGGSLRHGGHNVRVVQLSAGDGVIAKEQPDITVVASGRTPAIIVPVKKALASFDDLAFRSILAVVSEDTAAARNAAYAAGADDVVMSTASAAEFQNHIRSAERIVRLERRLRERVLELESALRRHTLATHLRSQSVAPASAGGSDGRGGLRFLLAHSWTDVDDILRNTCTQYLQCKYDQVAGAVAVPPGCPGARIGLTDVENQLSLEITFFVPMDSARMIAAMFTGDVNLVDDEVTKDVLLELANSGMGAVRAAFLKEEFRFAASTPKAVISGAAETALQRVEAKRILTFRHRTAVVHAVVAVRHQGLVKILGSGLREGMVIANDIKNDAGLLLVRAGTRLTETSAEKIARLIPNKQVELAEAA
jgi:DNA-binding NarL/FixJ family response regulator